MSDCPRGKHCVQFDSLKRVFLLCHLDARDQVAGQSHVWREVGEGGLAGESRGQGGEEGGQSRGQLLESSERGRGAA